MTLFRSPTFAYYSIYLHIIEWKVEMFSYKIDNFDGYQCYPTTYLH